MLGPDSFRRELAVVTHWFSHVFLKILKQFSFCFWWEEGLCEHEVPVSMSFLCHHFWIWPHVNQIGLRVVSGYVFCMVTKGRPEEINPCGGGKHCPYQCLRGADSFL